MVGAGWCCDELSEIWLSHLLCISHFDRLEICHVGLRGAKIRHGRCREDPFPRLLQLLKVAAPSPLVPSSVLKATIASSLQPFVTVSSDATGTELLILKVRLGSLDDTRNLLVSESLIESAESLLPLW